MTTTAERVPQHTSNEVNARIRHQTDQKLAACATAGPQAIDARLEQLDREWDIERTIEAKAATLALAGVILGAFVSPWFLLLPGIVTAFLLQHAVQGWCPPVPIFRRMGRRTQPEIAEERYALKALRGDFALLGSATGPGSSEERTRRALEAVRR